jgi:hypothetical protein
MRLVIPSREERRDRRPWCPPEQQVDTMNPNPKTLPRRRHSDELKA